MTSDLRPYVGQHVVVYRERPAGRFEGMVLSAHPGSVTEIPRFVIEINGYDHVLSAHNVVRVEAVTEATETAR